MRSIAVLYCAGGLNLGNEFINGGGYNLIKMMYPDAALYTFEVADSALGNWQHPSPAILPHQLDWINKHCDMAIMLGGSIITPACRPLLLSVTDITIPTVLMGASCCSYDDTDRAMAAWVHSLFDLVMTRDDITAGFMPDANTVRGLDMAFWYVNAHTDYHARYAVVNVDQGVTYEDMIGRREKLLEQGWPHVYIVENTEKTPKHVPGYLQIAYDWQLWNLYAQAGFVETCRIHSSIACVVNGTPFKYVGHDSGGIIGRNTLFNKIGIRLYTGGQYGYEEENQYFRDVLEAKSKAELIIIHALNVLEVK